ncbi:MAG TPA: DNRLRE domain-containing protein, partial [Candidatus Limnocylindria bacterium]|nr:DNRLRE domain-containing protein [Candidatus Limnocylindria bacterium]
MRRLAAGGMFWLSLFGLVPAVLAQNARITFSAMGDIPYGSSEVAILQQQIRDHNKYSPSELMVHVGDIKSSSSSCPEGAYRDMAGYLKALAVPAYVIPGDNEWNDCSNPSQAWGYWVEHLGDFEQNFCGAPATQRQSVRHENFAFVKNGVLFVGINLVGGSAISSSEWNTRLLQDADWVSQQLEANAGQVRAAVVFGHAGPGSSSHNKFFNPFRTAAASFAKPILYLHGDGHSWKFDRPWPEQNLRRIQVASGASADPVQVTVGLDAQNPWTVERNPFPGPVVNMAPCVDVGPDRSVTLPASASLSAKATDDGDPATPGSLSLTWSQVSGPGTVHFTTPNARTTNASFGVAGTYVLRLTASDGALQTSDELSVVAIGGPELAIGDVTVTEGDSGTQDAVFTVSLVRGTGAAVSVAYSTASGSASDGVDFVSTSGVLGFSGSTTNRSIIVPVRGDLAYEGTESFFVSLNNPSGATIADGVASGTILDNEPPAAPIVRSFTPISGPVGTMVTIEGTNFVAVTGVTFHGVAVSTFTASSSTQIHAAVPPGAGTGRIGIVAAAGSAESSADFVVTAPPPTLSFTPLHDAHVYSGSTTSNYGALATLRVRDETTDYRSYLKFEVTGLAGPVQRAVLRLYVTDESPNGGTPYLVSNNYRNTTTPWVESSLTWDLAPTIGSNPAGLAPGAAVVDRWLEFDVTAAITGNGTYSLVLKSSSTNSVIFSSKEGTYPPELVVTTAVTLPVDESAAATPQHLTLRSHPNPTRGRMSFTFV